MEKVIAFGILSLPIIALSWRTLKKLKSHGFYRFFCWECILWLLISNLKYWFADPFCIRQLIAWFLLFVALYLIIAGVILLRKFGKPNKNRDGSELYSFEKTSELIDTGLYKYIRHPLYASLLYLTWGIFLKQTTIPLFLISLFSTLFLCLTAVSDERECLEYFGGKYKEYMKRTNRFIPFIF